MPFPLVSEFKRLGDKNKFVAFIDSLLSGFGQIAFSDNPWSGLILIIGCFVGSFEQAVAGLCAAITATAFAYIIGTDKLVIRMGLFTFNAALAGLGIPLFIFPGQSVSVAMIILAVIAGIMCVLITAALNKIFSTRNVPSLALPYCITLFVLIPASLKLGTMHTTTSVVPFLDAPLGAENAQMTACSAGDFFTAVLNNMAGNNMAGEYLVRNALSAGSSYIVESRCDIRSDCQRGGNSSCCDDGSFLR